jgi:hypothetical protein
MIGECAVKKIVLLMLLLTFLLWGAPADAAAQTVSVKVADFPVTLNGVKCDSGYLDWLSGHARGLDWHPRYPLIVYKDITYIPMTWYQSNLLNVSTSWSAANGLDIRMGDPAEWKLFRYDTTDAKNRSAYSASIVDFPVTVNGKPIDNAKEPYPLLLFRDVTYFPLTWRFAVDEFGWRYSFSSAAGLGIESDNAFYYAEPVPEEKYPEDSDIIWHQICIMGDAKVWLEFHAPHRHMQDGDMFISQAGKVSRVGESGLDRFGSFDVGPGSDEFFRVMDGWVYAIYHNHREDSPAGGLRPPAQARVNMLTKEIEILK